MDKRLGSNLFAVATLLLPASAWADAEGDAQKLFEDAKALVRTENYAEACPKLEESQRLDPALGTQFNLADCYQHINRNAAAWTLFTEVEHSAKAAGKSEREKSAHARALALEPRIGRLTITAASQSELLQIAHDGERIPREAWGHPLAVELGAHAITATEPGKNSFKTEIKVAGGEAANVGIPELAPEDVPVVVRPVEPPVTTAPDHVEELSGQRKLALLVGGVGVVGLGVGGVFGLVSVSDHHAAASKCESPSPCGSVEGARDWTSATRAGNVSTVAFVAGGALVATGMVLWVLAAPPADRKNANMHITPIVGPGSAGISGQW